MAFEVTRKESDGRSSSPSGDNVDERSCVDALLDCSDRIESFVNTVSCDDWAEATTGWKATIPNPKFIPRRQPDPPPKKSKDEHRSPYEDAPFIRRPDAHYRYTTKTKMQPKSLKQISEITVPKKPADVGLQEHIDKVKEQLEVALRTKEPYDDTGMKKQLNDKFVHEFLENLTEQLKTENGHGGSDAEKTGEIDDTPYRVTMASASQTRNGKDNVEQQEWRRPDYRGELKLQDGVVRLNHHGVEMPNHDLELIVENTRLQSLNELSSKYNKPIIKPEKQMNLLDRINKKLDETLAEQDQYTVSLKRKSNSHGVDKLSSRSYEKFPAFTILPAEHADLRPLRKLTPSQRRASDDHDIATKLTQDGDLDGRHHISSAPLLSSTSSLSSSFSGERVASDSPNKNFMARGINGKSIKIPSTLKPSPYAQQSTTKDGNKKVNVRPRKLASIASPNNNNVMSPRPLIGDHTLFNTMDSGINKDTTIAAELLPGIDGRKMPLPLVTQRLL